MTLLLRHEEIEDLLSVDEVIAALRAGLDEQAAGEAQVPPRTTVDSTSGRGWLRLMPAIMNRSGVMGYKAMHLTPNVGVRYTVVLIDLDSGEIITQMDADWLTRQRTSATAAVATDLLAQPEIERVGMLGSSEQARALLVAMSRVRRFSSAAVFSPTPANREAFAATMTGRLGVPVMAVDRPEEAVRGAQMVGVAIRATGTPVLKAEWLTPGVHVNGISSVRPAAREVEDEVWRRSDVVAVDDRAHVLESGDGRSALASGAVRPDGPAELWELVAGKRQGRQRAEQITLFKSVGIPSQDLALGLAIYQRARQRGLGQEIGAFPHVRGFGAA